VASKSSVGDVCGCTARPGVIHSPRAVSHAYGRSSEYTVTACYLSRIQHIGCPALGDKVDYTSLWLQVSPRAPPSDGEWDLGPGRPSKEWTLREPTFDPRAGIVVHILRFSLPFTSAVHDVDDLDQKS
jgi:hypothetical protein